MINLYDAPAEVFVETDPFSQQDSGFKLSVKEWSIFNEYGLK